MFLGEEEYGIGEADDEIDEEDGIGEEYLRCRLLKID